MAQSVAQILPTAKPMSWKAALRWALPSEDTAIDLGTFATLVYKPGAGIVCNEPSVIALRQDDSGLREVVAVGREAREMVGRTPESISAIRPLKGGAIADFDAAEIMLRHFIKMGNHRGPRRFARTSRLLVCVPSALTAVQARAVRESAAITSPGSWTREVHLIQEPMAGAIGAGLEITGPQGHLIVDVGSGTTDVAVIALGGVVVSRSIPIAGDWMTNAIIEYVRTRLNLLIGERTAEALKCGIGSAVPSDKVTSMKIKGREAPSGLPTMLEATNEQVLEALREPLAEIVNSIHIVLEKTPPELAADIFDEGITLVGGGTLLQGLDELISKETRLQATRPEDPETLVAKGAGALLEDRSLLKKITRFSKK